MKQKAVDWLCSQNVLSVLSWIKKSRFVKEQEVKESLNNLGNKTLLSKIPLLHVFLRCIKVNEIVNRFLLAGDKFMPEMRLKKPGFTYLQKTKNRLKNLCSQEIYSQKWAW